MGNKLKRLAAALLIITLFVGCSDTTPSSGEVSSVVSEIQSSSSYISSDSSLTESDTPDSTALDTTSSSSESSSETSDISSSTIVSGSASGSSDTSSLSSSSSTSSISSASSLSSSSSFTSSSTTTTTTTTTTSTYSSSSKSTLTSSSTQSSTTSRIPIEPVDPSDQIQKIISKMSLKERIYQLFFVNPEAVTGSGRTVVSAIDLSDKPVGGILYMGANLQSISQTREMISGTQKNAMKNGIGIFVAVDEEGGSVARCASKLGTTAFNSMAFYGSRNDANEAFNVGKTIGADIGSLGFNVDFAPVADVDICPYNELGNRIFSSDPNVVANMVSNVVSGMRSSGVAATLKHFPGLGAENGNSHTASAIVIDRTLDQLRSVEFVPFKSGIQAGAEFVMVGHQQVTAFGDELPADLSYKAVTEMLRRELGFDGIAITDAQNMNTISNLYYSRTAAKMSVKAGIDMILVPADLDDAVNGVHNAVLSGEISEERINESVTRILKLKQKMGLLAS